MRRECGRCSVISLFSGLGGLDLGFEQAGYHILFSSDVSANATSSYEINFGRPSTCADIRALSPSALPEADVVIGGPPCQSFSLVGKRHPGDERGQLVFRFLDVIRAMHPRAFVMENVPGLAASRVEGVRLTDVLRGSFEEEGYFVTVMKLTASDFLVPQRRKRVFIVGCRDRPVPVPDPRRFARERYGVTGKDVDISARAAIGDLGPCVAKGERAPYSGRAVTLFAKLMRAHEPAGGPTLHECPRMSATDSEIVRHVPPGGNYRDIPDEIAPGRVLKFKKTGGRTTTYGRLHPDKPAYTINTYFRRPNVGCNFHYEQPRLITPREAMRFQSLPDHFELRYGSQDERNALIGNAVPPLLAEAIAWTVKEALNGRTCELPLLFCGS